jgi:hypothetical protein
MSDGDELVEGMRALDLTPSQRAELEADPDRALGWIRWAQKQGKGAGAVLHEFRSGDEAPDPDAWYADAERPKGPNPRRLLAACESLVRNTGHELTRADYVGETYVVSATGEEVVSEGEFERLGRDPKIGNGARLSDDDVRRLLAIADRMRESWEVGEDERRALDERQRIAYYRLRWPRWTDRQRGQLVAAKPWLAEWAEAWTETEPQADAAAPDAGPPNPRPAEGSWGPSSIFRSYEEQLAWEDRKKPTREERTDE